ncbi:MAG: T9SS type B sorting domain-containing protein [Nonlabens sp.]
MNKFYFILLTFVVGSATYMGNAQAGIIVPGNDNGGGGYLYGGCTGIGVSDSGGRRNNYSDNENSLATFCPDIPTDLVELNIFSLDLAAGDVLTIHDGDSTAAPVLFTGTAGTAAPGFLRATNSTPTGCLTLTFTSNNSGTAAGWQAARGCFNPCQAISPTVVTTPAQSSDGIVRICQGDTVNFAGSAVFSDDATGATYSYNLGNGGGLVSGANQTETYSAPGVYYVQFFATDNIGCSDRIENDVIIQVSTDPDFSGTRVEDSQICFGETNILFGVVQTNEFAVDVAPPIAGTTFLPDGNGDSYRTCVTVEGFPNGAILENPADIARIFMNMEHSYAGDLDIEITSPSGQTILLYERPGFDGSFFGEPIDIDGNLTPGVGYTYAFTEVGASETLQDRVSATGAGISVPIGDYLPEESFSGLAGSTLNGDWCLTITDFLSSDNGYIFEWGIEFSDGVLPDEIQYEPGIVSTRWLPDPTIEATNGNRITVRPDTAGVNCYTYELTDSFGCIYTETVCFDVAPEINAGDPTDYTFCSNGTATTLDLTENDVALLASLDPATHDVNYYRTEEEAFDQVNEITDPENYPIPAASETVYSAVFDTNLGCADVEEIEINIIDFDAIDVTELQECESLMAFDIEDYIRTNTGLGNSSDISISIHDSQNDADTPANPRGDLNNYDQASGTTTLYVRFQSTVNSVCSTTDSFDISIIPSVLPNTLTNLEDCANEDGSAVSFDLGDQDTDVLNGSAASDFTISYHETQQQAMDDDPALPFMNYETSTNQTIYVRIENQANPICYTLNSFDVIVNELPQLSTAPDIDRDDDLSDDGVEIFDLTENDDVITSSVTAPNFTTSYHSSFTAAENGTPELPASYPNTDLNETIFVRVENTDTFCYSITDFDINVIPLPDLGTANDLTECDDPNSADTIFVLSQNTASILGGRTDITVTYHANFAQADAGTDELDDTNYPLSANSQTIFYRVQLTSGTVYNVGSFELSVIAAPNAFIPDPLEDCDDNTGAITLNLMDRAGQITGGQSDTTLSFYADQADADVPTNPLPTNYEISNNETIVVRVDDDNSVCYSLTTLDLIFNASPQLTQSDPIENCDDLSEDGVGVFDLTRNENAILENNTAVNIQITYHSTPSGAQDGSDLIDSNYLSNTSRDTVYVRVFDTDTECVSTTSFDVVVKSLPDVGDRNDLDLVECDDAGNSGAVFKFSENNPGILDGRTNVNLSYYRTENQAIAGGTGLDENNYVTNTAEEIFYRVENTDTDCFNVGSFRIEVVGAPIAIEPLPLEGCIGENGSTEVDLLEREGQITDNNANASVSFYKTQDDAENENGAVNTNFEFSENQTLVVRVDADNTDCASYTTIDVIINPLPQPDLDSEYLLCVDTDGTLINGPVVLDTGLNNTDYSFEWYLEEVLIAGANDSSYNATEEGNYEVVAEDILTECTNSSSTFVRERGVPETYDVQVVTDPFDLTHNVIATATGPDEYWFSLDDGPYLYTGKFEDVLPGPHTVKIAERSGCGEIVVEIFVIGYPDFFTPNDDGYHDTWNVTGGDLLPGTSVNIFDRYGKLIASLDPSGPGWDGTFNGQPLPSSDYWFLINYEVDGVSAESRGHFAMKR